MAATVANRPATRRTKRDHKTVAVKIREASRAGAHSEYVEQLGVAGEALEWPVHGEAVTVASLPAARKKRTCWRVQRR
jgi:hypothetical protein